METKRRQLLDLLSDHLGRPIAELERMDRFDELDIDSIGLIDMITVVETAFSVRIPNETLDRLHSLSDLVGALEALEECENS